MATIQIKRVYEPAKETDGFRVLVDRLWPRGIKKESLHANAWMKELAPTPSLRIWFKHHPEKWTVFCHSYFIELKLYTNIAALQEFCSQYKKITLLYASKDKMHNHAVILQQFLAKLQKGKLPGTHYSTIIN